MKRASCLALLMVVMQGAVFTVYADGWDPNTNADNLVSEGIKETRHNMTMSYIDAYADRVTMDLRRTNYGEICVYCHTPHGANNSAGGLGMPLWNRTIDSSLLYETYDTPTTLGLTVTAPGPASLTCLSCHDGVTAIDSIINMPGSGKYLEAQETSVNDGFLDEWLTIFGVPAQHQSLAGCTDVCHGDTSNPPDFRYFVIGAGTADGQYVDQIGDVVDLRDDHPVGILYPTAFSAWVDFKPMNIEVPGRYAFFDDGNGRADKYEIRVYDSGDGFEVECASCHDPHGVPDAANFKFIPSFLRVDNTASALCLTCHIK